MKFRIMSDLHVEFEKDWGQKFIGSLPLLDEDVLILAGDISTTGGLYSSVSSLCKRDPNVKVYHVSGNHEYYRSDRGKVNNTLSKIERHHDNFKSLNCQTHELPDGRKIHGCTLWFPDSPAARSYRQNLNDFRIITGFKKWIWDTAKRHREFLHDAVGEGDIVVTHHLPSYNSVDPRFKYGSDSVLNCYYVHPMEDLILDKKPSLWVHGHTHASQDYLIGDCRVICNPRGYVNSPDRWNSGFRDDLIVSV